MNEVDGITPGSEPGAENQTTEDSEAHKPGTEGLSRRNFLGVSSTALATAALAGLTAHAQEAQGTRRAEKDNSSSDPGEENKPLLNENPSSNMPPPTDHGDIGPIWYSFDLARQRVQEGGWTHEVNNKVLPTSTDLTGVNMRLTKGSFRELHWHTADEWAIMLYGKARVWRGRCDYDSGTEVSSATSDSTDELGMVARVSGASTRHVDHRGLESATTRGGFHGAPSGWPQREFLGVKNEESEDHPYI